MSADTAAGVNATVASILMAALALYVAQVFGPLDRLRRRINNSVARVSELGAGVAVDENDPEAASNDFAAVRERLNRLSILASGGVPDGVEPDEESRGGEVQRLMRGLLSHYPFPTRLRPHPSGQGFMIDANARLKLKDLKAIEQWVRDARYLSGRARYLFAEDKEVLQRLLGAVTPDGPLVLDDSIFQGSRSPGPLATLLELADAIPPEAVLSVQALLGLGDIAQETGQLLGERRAYLNDTPSRWPFVVVAILGFIALICGAVVPMFHVSTSAVVTVWVPSGIYAVAGLAGLWAAYNALRA